MYPYIFFVSLRIHNYSYLTFKFIMLCNFEDMLAMTIFLWFHLVNSRTQLYAYSMQCIGNNLDFFNYKIKLLFSLFPEHEPKQLIKVINISTSSLSSYWIMFSSPIYSTKA
jgi:hypothetical protein